MRHIRISLRAVGVALLILGTPLSSARAQDAACAFARTAKVSSETPLFVLAEGDSITAGTGASDGHGSYVNRAFPLIGSPKSSAITAVSQSVLGWPGSSGPPNSLFARMAHDNRLIPKDKNGRVFVLTILIGRNDLVGYYGGMDQYLRMLGQYVAQMKQAGWDRVVLGTLLPSDWAPFGPVRAAFNARVKMQCWAVEHGIDAIADFSAVAALVPDTAAAERTYFVDGTHPSNLGYTLMAPVYAQALNDLRRRQ